jgi:hypothetical protein
MSPTIASRSWLGHEHGGGEMRAIGDEQVRRDARVETRICARAGTEGEYGSVTAGAVSGHHGP